jgi:hypothetical protein
MNRAQSLGRAIRSPGLAFFQDDDGGLGGLPGRTNATALLENYIFLTPGFSMNEPNGCAGRKWQIAEEISNDPEISPHPSAN